jgi:hypothetical protein
MNLGRLQRDMTKNDPPLRKVLNSVDEAMNRLPPRREQRDPAEFGPPHARPPRVSPDGVLAEFEAHAQSCEEVLTEIRMMLKTEEQSWERLAAQYRELGQVQATAVHDMLQRIAAMRDARSRLAHSLDGAP